MFGQQVRCILLLLGNLFRLGRPGLRRFALTALTAVKSESESAIRLARGALSALVFATLAVSRSMMSSVEVRFELRGFMLLEWWLDARSGPVQQRTLRQNGQSLLELVPRELSRTLLQLLLALHGFGNAHVIELGESLHHSWQLCVHGIPVADQLVSRVLRSRTLLLLVLHVLSVATSCTDFSSVALITVAFSVTACAVSDFTVMIVVTEVSASSTTFRLQRV